jgi:hypothetical protein
MNRWIRWFLEIPIWDLKAYNSKFHAVFATLRQMLEAPIPLKKKIGFPVSAYPPKPV